MGARPHAHIQFQEPKSPWHITIDLRAFWGEQCDYNVIKNELQYSFQDLLDEVQRVFEEREASRSPEVRET